MHEDACYDAKNRITEYIDKGIENLWIKKTDGFDYIQSTPSVPLYQVSVYRVTIDILVHKLKCVLIDR